MRKIKSYFRKVLKLDKMILSSTQISTIENIINKEFKSYLLNDYTSFNLSHICDDYDVVTDVTINIGLSDYSLFQIKFDLESCKVHCGGSNNNPYVLLPLIQVIHSKLGNVEQQLYPFYLDMKKVNKTKIK